MISPERFIQVNDVVYLTRVVECVNKVGERRYDVFTYKAGDRISFTSIQKIGIVSPLPTGSDYIALKYRPIGYVDLGTYSTLDDAVFWVVQSL